MTDVKKRGRKPRGGKIVTKADDHHDKNVISTCVVVQLKCHLKDLDTNVINADFVYNPTAPPQVKSHDPQSTIDFTPYENALVNQEENTNISVTDKLRDLKVQLYKQDISKTSACFWCTYGFNNPACYIPYSMENDNIVAYGSFCCPECAVAYLFNETLDDAVRFERYSLINFVYGKIYDYKKNIRAAPNPHYLLDKFYGNLSINEYRKMIQSDHVLLQLDRPMSRLMPEIHSDGNTTINAGEVSAGTKYCVKRASEKKQGPSKKSLIAGHFGIQ